MLTDAEPDVSQLCRRMQITPFWRGKGGHTAAWAAARNGGYVRAQEDASHLAVGRTR